MAVANFPVIDQNALEDSEIKIMKTKRHTAVVHRYAESHGSNFSEIKLVRFQRMDTQQRCPVSADFRYLRQTYCRSNSLSPTCICNYKYSLASTVRLN